MSILSLQSVSKSFGALTVTDDVTFEVPQGQALGIIGPNGAGTSTLFNLITGNLTANSGTINFEGRDVTRTSAMDRCMAGIGRSFQIPQPFEKLTVYENLLVAATHGRRLGEAAVRDDCADMPVVADLQERVENMFVGRGGQVRLIVARPQAPRDREPARRSRADEHLAAADLRHARCLFPYRVANAHHARC